MLAFTRSADGDTLVYIANLFYEKLGDISVDLGFDSADCVLHWDGTNLDAEKKTMTKDDFAKRDYQLYEFYILTVKG